MTSRQLPWPSLRPFLPSVLLFVLIVSTAPAVGHIRDFIFETFPAHGVKLLVAGFAAAAAGFFVYALARIRTHRWLRYAGLVAVLGLLWVQTVGLATDQIQVDAAEKIHILEYGALAFLLYRALLHRSAGSGDFSLLAVVFFGVALAGTADEWVQWLAPLRTGDVRDVVLNATAGLSGLLFALSLSPPERWTWRLDARHFRLFVRGTAVTVLFMGLFFYRAHLGYEIEDPEIGRFRSRFTVEELRELAAQRKEEWAANPPTGLKTWGIEDYFLSEAADHANFRNASYRSGLFTWAWLANRALEKYFDPFLDIDSFRGSGRHRYAPNVRRDLEAKKGPHDPRTYRSQVLVNRIYPWPKPLFLTLLGAAVVLLWILPRWLRSAGRTRDREPRLP